MKIIVRQLSGLGNQMFQYAAGLFYAAQHNAEVQLIVDPPQRAHSYGDPRPFLLSHFAITAPHREVNTVDRLLLRTERRLVKPVAAPLLKKILHVQMITESLVQRFRFQPELSVDEGVRTVYLSGFWQVHAIADMIPASLRRELTLRAPPTGRNLEMMRKIIDTENSVSIHIRRGDYTLAVEGNVALSIGYYTRAIEQIKASLSNPTFFVFSDDTAFAREMLGNDSSVVFIDHNDAFSAQEDLRLMTSCLHHIIANSTFSWWGAWLSSRAEKIVIAPRHWRVANCPPQNDLIPSDWRLLD